MAQIKPLLRRLVQLHPELERLAVRLMRVWARITGAARGAGDFVNYRRWTAVREVPQDEALQRREMLAGRDDLPVICVLTPIYQPEPDHLRAALASLQAQTYPHWRAIWVDDASPDPATRALIDELTRAEPRIRLVRRAENGGIAAATNDAIDRADGEICAFLDHDDMLSPDALEAVWRSFAEAPEAVLVFTDEDKLDKNGRRCEPYFKPGVNRALFYARNYFNHLTAVRTEALREVGGLPAESDGSQDYALILALAERHGWGAFQHCPGVHYHWRKSVSGASFSEARGGEAWTAGARALKAHLDRAGASGVEAVEPGFAGAWRLRFRPLGPDDHVSVILPTRDKTDLVEACLADVRRAAGAARLDILVIDNGSSREESLDWFRRAEAEQSDLRVIRAPGGFNFSRLINLGAAEAKGELFLIINNDILGPRSDWMTELAGYARLGWAGAVGAKLSYPNGRLQHGGVVLGLGGGAGHLERGASRGEAGAFSHLQLPRCVSAVTGACLMVRRDVFEAVGGFDESDFPIAYSDVDFCLRVREAGYENVWTPYAHLTHFEGASRGREAAGAASADFDRADAFLRRKYAGLVSLDPFHNPHLDRVDEQVRLKN